MKGSGLGLATVYSIIKNHGGRIDTESQPGNGAAFHVYLPAMEKKTADYESSEETPMKGMGKILVMDDEEIVREVAGELLGFLGYEVTLCADGNTAVSLYRQAWESGEGYSAVIMDLTIPGGMGGRETMEKLLELDPDAKGIVSSGYNNDPILSNCCDYGFSGVVTKPYTMKELNDTIQTVLHPACT